MTAAAGGARVRPERPCRSNGPPSLRRRPSPPSRCPRPVPPVEPAGDLKAAPVGRATDEDLMRRTQTGDRAAFSLLYDRYSNSVLSYLYRMLGNVEDVESIGQEVFLRAFRFAPTYRYPQKFSTWLFTITRNLAINQSRRKRRSPIRTVTELNLEGVDVQRRPLPSGRVRRRTTWRRREEIVRMLKGAGRAADRPEGSDRAWACSRT